MAWDAPLPNEADIYDGSPLHLEHTEQFVAAIKEIHDKVPQTSDVPALVASSARDEMSRRVDQIWVQDAIEMGGARRVRAHFDASVITGTAGQEISVVPDISGNAQDATATVRPTLRVEAQNGLNLLRFGPGAFATRPGFGSTSGNEWGQNPVSQPLVLVAVASVLSSTAPGTSPQVIVGGGLSSAQVQMYLIEGHLRLSAGTANAFRAGPFLRDDQLHIFVSVFSPRGVFSYVDGYLTDGIGGNTFVGANSMTGLGIFSRSDGGNIVGGGDFAEALVIEGFMTHAEVAELSANLAQKWGLS